MFVYDLWENGAAIFIGEYINIYVGRDVESIERVEDFAYREYGFPRSAWAQWRRLNGLRK